MSDRASALLYGVGTMCAIALLLLVINGPAGRNLAFAAVVGIVVTLVALWRQRG